ncbi:MAG: energy transducer TonB [Bacteroidales bacterium]|nr:energy transducer TonB [Candidatus Cryptobacteroides aphodequi]
MIIVLLLTVVTPTLRSQSQFEMDFSELEEFEKLQKELEFKKDVNRRLNELLAQNGLPPINPDQGLRNVAVNRHTQDLLDENARLQKDIKETLEQKSEATVSYETVKVEKVEQSVEYTGPSVVSYDLGGRKASYLPIPAYKCYGGGEVTVIIIVDPKGSVLSAKIQEDVSTGDACLREFALRAASRARFSLDSNAPAKQRGDIVYAFIAQ